MDSKDQQYFLDRDGIVARQSKVLAPYLKEKFEEKKLAYLKQRLQECSAAYDCEDHLLSDDVVTLSTAAGFATMIDPDRNVLPAILFAPAVREKLIDRKEIVEHWGDDTAQLIDGLLTTERFLNANTSIDQDNFRGLLLSLSGDIRVIIIMIVRTLMVMRLIDHHPDNDWVTAIAFEANCIFAQLAHRLGLYAIKGELEDLSLKYTNRDIYVQIARKLNETKRSRDAYIKEFIAPVKDKLEAAGLKFDIKGRTKSISSIWAKMRKQKVDIDRIYDLFAIRVIIDAPPEREKADCWLAYSILADMYRANPARMRDWITIPKSNGYESLHATVLGPGQKWVEVQFRTRRMDLVAEKGLAAHWRYKGGKAADTDRWMNNVRDVLESAESGPMQLMKDLRMDAFGNEVYVFTPKGDLFRLPAGASVLDFAFHIHTNVGAHCTGAIVNDSHQKITYRISNGDTVEVLTSSSQRPTRDWLNAVVTPKARNKIRAMLNEERAGKSSLGRETLERRLRNRKLQFDETAATRIIKRMGYKSMADFFADIADERTDIRRFLNDYRNEISHDEDTEAERVAAENFRVDLSARDDEKDSADEVVIGDRSISGLNYRFARCCSPVPGDKVFGFISSDGIVKIHKTDCPNAANIRRRYPYRIIRTVWSNNATASAPVQLKIIGKDDIGIVANISSLINKEAGVSLRSISIDSHDSLFSGFLSVFTKDAPTLNSLIRKLKGVKGVKNVIRL